MSENPQQPVNPLNRSESMRSGLMEMWIRIPKRRQGMTLAIVIVTVLVYGLQLISQTMLQMDVPLNLFALAPELIYQGQVWRLMTEVLVHGSILHIGLNMLAFYTLGRSLERFYGSWRMLVVYLMGALGGGLFHFYFSDGVAIGAATGLFALAAAQLVLFLRNRFLWGPENQHYIRNFFGILAINLVINLFPGMGGLSLLGGLLAGLGFAWFAGPHYGLNMTAEDSQLFDLVDRVEPRQVILVSAVALAVMGGLVALRIFTAV